MRVQVLKWLTRVFGHRKLWEGTGRRVTIETSLCDALLGCLEDGVLEVREVAQCVHLQAECSVFESLDLAQMNMHTQPALPHVLTLTRATRRLACWITDSNGGGASHDEPRGSFYVIVTD